MPPAARTASPEAPADPYEPDGVIPPDDAKADSKAAKSEPADKAPDLFVIAYERDGTSVVELLSEDQAESRVGTLTYGSKQHRKLLGDDVPEGGGTHEINRRDMHVYKLNTTPVTDF